MPVPWSPRAMKEGKMMRLFVAGLLSAAGIASGIAAQAQVTVEGRLAAGQPPAIGGSASVQYGGLPTDSLAGLEHAIGLGVDLVRITTQLTRDGQYILLGDRWLNEKTDVEAVFPDGPPGGPTRDVRGGRDYARDYTLEEIRRLRLTDGQDGGVHRIATLAEALDLIDERVLVMLSLKAHEVDSLATLLSALPTESLLLRATYYEDPAMLADIAGASGLPVAVSLGTSRDGKDRDCVAALNAVAAGLHTGLRVFNVRSKWLTPACSMRAAELGVAVGISGYYAEDSALIFDDDPGPWLAALATGAAVFTTDYPEAVLALRD